MLMFELLFWVWRERQPCLSHMHQMYLQGTVSAGDWKSTSKPQEYFWSILARGKERDHHFCAQRKCIICRKAFEDLCWLPIKVSPSPGSRPLMVEKFDPRVADTSRAEQAARAQLGGLQEGGGSSTKWFGLFVLFWMSAKQFVGHSVPFPTQVPELLGHMVLSLLCGGGWKEVMWGTLPPACVMTGQEGLLC